MSNSLTSPKTKIQNSNLFTFAATLSGVVVGVVASLAMVGPMVHSEVASATAGFTKTINARTASSVLACTGPSSGDGSLGAAGKPQVLGASTTMQPQGGLGGGDNGSQPGNVWVHKFVSGVWATNTATISGNGADSNNKVVTVNKNTTIVKNDNNVHVTNNNEQKAESGNAKTDENTGSNASAASGAATNTSKADMSVNITN